MSYPIDRGLGYPQSPQASTLEDLAEELVRARTKFPANKRLLGALTEELGELAEELKQSRNMRATVSIKKEALQVACVAVRIYEEFDATMPLDEYSAFVDAIIALGNVARYRLQQKGEYHDARRELLDAVSNLSMRDPYFANMTQAETLP